MPDSPASSNQIDSASDSFPAVEHHALRERGDQEIKRRKPVGQRRGDGSVGGHGVLAHEDFTFVGDDHVARGVGWASSGRRGLELQATRQSEHVREP